MLSKKQIMGAWRKGRIHIRLKQLSKMLGIKCEPVFLDADNYEFWLSSPSFTMAFCCAVTDNSSQLHCSWGWFGLKCELCWKWRRIFLVDQRQISWCVFSPACIWLFSTTTTSMLFVSIRSCAEIHFGLIVVPTIQQMDHPIVVLELQRSGLSSAHRRWKPLLRYAGI